MSKFIVSLQTHGYKISRFVDLLNGQEFHRNLQEMNPETLHSASDPLESLSKAAFEKERRGDNLPPPSDYNCMRLQQKYS
ncbi:hypothetical protein CEXT_156031 [Caerostris extrusa]|uniref:Uncharacterized protein n=1 Tax=Caerostris extrusa TaxID=172846 RepID=A0AAV4QDH9_CAEEX|nr:hypothetical protein CEXT_156031 [Caerostris extrusa]